MGKKYLFLFLGILSVLIFSCYQTNKMQHSYDGYSITYDDCSIKLDNRPFIIESIRLFKYAYNQHTAKKDSAFFYGVYTNTDISYSEKRKRINIFFKNGTFFTNRGNLHYADSLAYVVNKNKENKISWGYYQKNGDIIKVYLVENFNDAKKDFRPILFKWMNDTTIAYIAVADKTGPPDSVIISPSILSPNYKPYRDENIYRIMYFNHAFDSTNYWSKYR